jgi:hypothetical protein
LIVNRQHPAGWSLKMRTGTVNTLRLKHRERYLGSLVSVAGAAKHVGPLGCLAQAFTACVGHHRRVHVSDFTCAVAQKPGVPVVAGRPILRPSARTLRRLLGRHPGSALT